MENIPSNKYIEDVSAFIPLHSEIEYKKLMESDDEVRMAYAMLLSHLIDDIGIRTESLYNIMNYGLHDYQHEIGNDVIFGYNNFSYKRDNGLWATIDLDTAKVRDIENLCRLIYIKLATWRPHIYGRICLGAFMSYSRDKLHTTPEEAIYCHMITKGYTAKGILPLVLSDSEIVVLIVDNDKSAKNKALPLFIDEVLKFDKSPKYDDYFDIGVTAGDKLSGVVKSWSDYD